MLIEPIPPTQKELADAEAKDNALRRLSKRCPVIISANKALDDMEKGKHVDIEYALDIIVADLRGKPVASATIKLIQRILSFKG